MVKILSNFDTQSPAKNYANAVQEFGFNKVIFLRRHKLYFFLYTLTPAICAILLLAYTGFSFFAINATSKIESTLVQHTIEIIIVLLATYLLILSRGKYFEYILDYTIITPWYISSYNQRWVFARTIKTIEPEKIKTINFSSWGFINSLFNFGIVSILLEWDDAMKWEIVIDFIYNPEWVKRGILDITEDTNIVVS